MLIALDAEKLPPTWPDAETAFIAEMKRQRGRQNLSQGDLAERVKALGGNMFQQTVAKLESGQRALRMAEADIIAAALGMTMTSMLASAYTPDRGAELDDAEAQLKATDERLKVIQSETHRAREEYVSAERHAVTLRSRLEALTREYQELQDIKHRLESELEKLQQSR